MKIGHLDNGLTYHIRHNSYPEHEEATLPRKWVPINETDDQRVWLTSLSTSTGTDHFKGNSLQDYLQSIGGEYGRNLNAYTSVEKPILPPMYLPPAPQP